GVGRQRRDPARRRDDRADDRRPHARPQTQDPRRVALAVSATGRLRPRWRPGPALTRVPPRRRVRVHRRAPRSRKEVPMTIGKTMRLKRVIDPAGVSIICALDHGMTSPTFLEPLADIASRAAETVAGGANVIMMSKGMIRIAHPAFLRETSLAMLLSASASPDGNRPQIVQIGEVEEALRLGADAVVLFTALGGDAEAGMIQILAGVGRECEALGMPFIAEAEFPTTYASVEALKEQ